MLATYSNSGGNDSLRAAHADADAGAPGERAWHHWIGQTLVAGILGAGAAALALVLLLQLFAVGGSALSVAVLGAGISGAAAGVVQARRLPGAAEAPAMHWVTPGMVLGAAVAGLGIAWLRALRLGEAPIASWDAEMGALYGGIGLSAALLFAAGQGLLLHTSGRTLAGWSIAGEVVWLSELLAWAGPAALLLVFFVSCGFGMPLPLVLSACLGLPGGALIGFVLARLLEARDARRPERPAPRGGVV